jgi:uncharacterized protein YjbI with pentapeptide repeats
LVVAFAFWLSFWEGRWAGEPWIGRRDIASTANGVVFGLFPDRLKLASEAIVVEELLEKTKKEIASRGGDFVPTIKFDRRDLQAADLSGADLRGVSLNHATMQNAKLLFVRLDGARLFIAQLQGANLGGAELQGAELIFPQLQGADLGGAELQGADLGMAQLQGADLQHAQLQGANLAGAQLQGANLQHAQLQGANLIDGSLQGANLSQTQLQGAELYDGSLQGAHLSQAQLQGADLSRADLSDSIFTETFVFKANVASADLTTAAIGSIHSDQVKRGDHGKIEPLVPPDIDAWIAAATQFVPEKYKAIIVERLARLKADFRETDQEPTWLGMEEASLALDPDGARHRQRLAALLGDLACSPDGAPLVARGLVENGPLPALGNQIAVIRARMKNGRDKPDACKGVAGFTEDDWRALDAIKPD